MDKVKNLSEHGSCGRHARRPASRRLIQLYAVLLHNAYLKGFITGEIYKGSAKILCAPGLNCYSCPGAAASCPLGAIQNALASAGHRAGWYVLGIIMLYGVILGRTVCGWLCPMGLLQELLHGIPALKLKKSAFTKALSWLKYLLLAVFVITIPLWYSLKHGIPLPAFCKYICPAGTLEGAVGLLSNPANASYFSMLGLLFTRKFVIMLATGLACVFFYRAFCRFICPLGAIYGIFNRFSIVGVRVDEQRCNHCGACVRGCGMDVRHVGDHECIQCGRCMSDCAQGAISIKAGRITLVAPAERCAGEAPDESRRRVRLSRRLWVTAIALLCFVLLWVNVLDPASQKTVNPTRTLDAESTADLVPSADPVATEVPTTEAPALEAGTSDATVGHEPGDILENFSLTCYDGGEFRLSDQRGRIVFINLWATYCTPCVRELSYFDELQRAHVDDISVIAVHSGLVTDDPETFLSDKGYELSFATDGDNALAERVGSSGTLPQTVVLNRRGEIVYNKVGSVTPELLEALYDEAN